jgi:hypothetical protein
MTTNQRRAIRLAQCVFDGRVSAGDLSEDDWVLLILAAGVMYSNTPATGIALRVLRDARGRTGYFRGDCPEDLTPQVIPPSSLGGATDYGRVA